MARLSSAHTLAQLEPGNNSQNLGLLPASAYPVLGIGYFAKTPRLWIKVFCHLLVAVAISFAAIILLFVFVLKLQVDAFSSLIPGGWAWAVSVILVIAESAVVTLLTGLIYLQAFALDDIFDNVMKKHGFGDLQKHTPGGTARGFYRFLHPIFYALTMLMALPLNLIPIIGSYMFLVCCAYFASWGAHLHYFDIKGLTWSESKSYIQQNWSNYFQFGSIAGMLEAIPLIGLFFMMTNVIGGALWAIDLEKAEQGPRVIQK
jgi:uncharacterized protein involved in cysteine biosynthesis